MSGGETMRNKAKNFPITSMKGEAGKARAKSEYASKRADGTINTHPQERMRASNQRTTDT
jgi:small acid-soluble spore protein K (minor)